MPILEVKSSISLFYLDSGIPNNPSNETYITLFMLHGAAFYSPIFSRAMAVSSKYNVRFVAITRRDYPGSSPLAAEDVKLVLDGPTEKRLQAFADRAEEILLFIDKFIDKNNIPPINPDGGGFSLSGWSLGNLQGLSALAFGNIFPNLMERLTPFFRSYILHEATTLFPPPLDAYHPLTDEAIPKEERGHHFRNWISSYFVHPAEGFDSGDAALLNQRTPSMSKPSSVSQFTPEDLAAIVDIKPLLRTDIFYSTLDQKVNESILERAFHRQDSQMPPPWPNVPARTLYGEETSWTTIFTQRKLDQWLQRLRETDNHGWIRPFETNCVPGINHFPQWDEPDKFMALIKQLML